MCVYQLACDAGNHQQAPKMLVGFWILAKLCSWAGGPLSDTHHCSPLSRLELSWTQPSGQLNQQNVGRYLKFNSKSTDFSQEIERHTANLDASIFPLCKYELYLNSWGVKLQYNIIHISGQVKQIRPSMVPEGKLCYKKFWFLVDCFPSKKSFWGRAFLPNRGFDST